MTLARSDEVTKMSMFRTLLDLMFVLRRLLPGKSGSMPLTANQRKSEDVRRKTDK